MSRKKSIDPVSVLGSVNTVDKSLTLAPDAASAPSGSEQSSEQSESECALAAVRKQLADLYASCPPLSSNKIQEYLALDDGADAALIRAWADYGRRDRTRTVDLHLNDVARRTVTPLGYACLIAYARAWLDEAEAIAFAASALAARCCHSQGSAAKRQPPGTTRQPLVRVGVASRRRKS